MDLGFLSIDFNAIFNAIWRAIYKIIRIPFRFIHNLPDEVKIAIYIFLTLIMIIVALLLWKYRNEWRSVERI